MRYDVSVSLYKKFKVAMGLEERLKTLDVGGAAPGFELPSMDGKTVTLDSLLKKGPVVAAFFKVSCPVCQFTFPFLQRIHERFAKTVTVVGVSQDGKSATASFNKDQGVTFPVLLDSHPYAVSNAYGLTNVPSVFLIRPNRTVEVACIGFSKSDLESISRKAAEVAKEAPGMLFRKDEIVPEYKPGCGSKN